MHTAHVVACAHHRLTPYCRSRSQDAREDYFNMVLGAYNDPYEVRPQDGLEFVRWAGSIATATPARA
mgnify:CR=1 FL=1